MSMSLRDVRLRQAGQRRQRTLGAILAAAVLLAGCTPSGFETGRQSVAAIDGRNVAPKVALKVAWPAEPESLNPKWFSGSGVSDFVWLFNSFLTYYDFGGTLHPMIAREIPTRENGGWQIDPDGTIVTTFRLRSDVLWDDGQRVTARDFVFAYQVYTDRVTGVLHKEIEDLMSSVDAVDDATLVVTWSEPYIGANALGYRALNPMPRHLLEDKYRENRAAFSTGEEWTSGYVGSGPFRVERWAHGSGLTAKANQGRALGSPKISLIEVRFISDPSTLLANLLAGELDLINSPGIRANEAVVIRDQWAARGEGYLKLWATRISFLEFQYRSVPRWQAAVADIRVRQALSHAVDRQGLVDTVNEGLGDVAHAQVASSDALFGEVDRQTTKYPYDPARAEALLGDAGWRRDAGGSLRSSSGQTLDLEVMTIVAQSRAATIIADNWSRLGISAAPQILAPAMERDREVRTGFPSTQLSQRGLSASDFVFISAQTPANTGGIGANRGSFSDPEMDRLHLLSLTSFEPGERAAATVGLHRRMSEVAGYLPLLYSVEVIAARNRVKGPVGNYGPQIGITWNVQDWEIVE
jgi:peptide/nickel transport system substrate-binding protein